MITADKKAELLARVEAHAALDAIRQGAYFAWTDDDGEGDDEVGWDTASHYVVCAVGCALVDPESPGRTRSAFAGYAQGFHELQEQRWGIPAPLGELEDVIFESLPRDQAVEWPRRFVNALPPDIDLTPVVRLWEGRSIGADVCAGDLLIADLEALGNQETPA